MTRFEIIILLVFKILPNKNMTDVVVCIAEKLHLINKDSLTIKSRVNTTNGYYRMVCPKRSFEVLEIPVSNYTFSSSFFLLA